MRDGDVVRPAAAARRPPFLAGYWMTQSELEQVKSKQQGHHRPEEEGLQGMEMSNMQSQSSLVAARR